MYQAIGFKCFSETLFEDAGRNLFNGKLDPRVLVSYFPDLRGSLFSEGESEVDVFSGVAERMPSAKSIEELSKYLSPRYPNTHRNLVYPCANRQRTHLFFLLLSFFKCSSEMGTNSRSQPSPQLLSTSLTYLFTHTRTNASVERRCERNVTCVFGKVEKESESGEEVRGFEIWRH